MRHNDTTTQQNSPDMIKRVSDTMIKLNWSFKYVIAMSFLLLFGCSSSSNPTVAGGSGTETTNGIVMLSTGKPAANARVSIVDRDLLLNGNDSEIVTVTDENGYFSVEHDSIAREQIIVTSETEAVSMFGEDLKDTAVLAPYCTFSGTVTAQSSGFISLGGINTTTLVTNGSFVFEKVPSGWYPVFFNDGSKRYLAGSVTITSNLDTVITVQSSGVLLADFSESFERNPLTELFGGTEWKTFTSKEQQIYRDGAWRFELYNDSLDTTTITPKISGGTLYVATNVMNHSGSYAGIRLKLFSENLSRMTALKFRARGNGNIRMNLEAGVLNGTNDQYGVLVPLTATWQEFTIPVTDFHLENKVQEGLTPWSSVSTKIQRIELSFHGSANLTQTVPLSLEIDDIVYVGCDLDQL